MRINQQPRDVEAMLVWCWSTVFDAGPASNQHYLQLWCLLGACMMQIWPQWLIFQSRQMSKVTTGKKWQMTAAVVCWLVRQLTRQLTSGSDGAVRRGCSRHSLSGPAIRWLAVLVKLADQRLLPHHADRYMAVNRTLSPSKHDTLKRWCFNVGPASQTLGQD